MSSLALEAFGQHKLRYILCPHSQRDIFGQDIHCVLNSMEVIWPKHVVSSLAGEVFNQHLLRRSHTSCVRVAEVGVWSTHVSIHFVSPLAWVEFGQYILR